MRFSNDAGTVHVKVDDHILEWAAKQARRDDIALGAAAQDIEMIAAYNVPVDTGNLAKHIKKRRRTGRHWRVEVNESYAAYQERGMRADGSHIVRRYSRPGSGAHYLANAGNVVAKRFSGYFERANITTAKEFSSGSFKKLSSRTDVEGYMG